MREQITRALLMAAALSSPAGLAAQRGRGGESRPPAERQREPASRAVGRVPPIPREPVARAPGHLEPPSEPGRPPNAVPYVRNDQWYGHGAPDDARFHLDRPFQFGHFGLVGPSHVFSIARDDLADRRVWLPGGMFQIAEWDWAVAAPWCWTCDQFVVYLDPDHPGWYLLYDVRMGEYVHAEFMGP